jgi:hypothetical protein
MFSPGRLLGLGILVFGVYVGFFATPAGGPAAADFDPELVARYEASAWRAARVEEEFSTFVNCLMYQRELHRLSWFRAAESALPLSRAVMQFPAMANRFERIMPQLEQVAAIEKGWKGADFDPFMLARVQLNWMVTARDPRRSTNAQSSVADMAEDLGQRFGMDASYMSAPAADRAQAFQVILGQRSDPDWESVTEQLARAYAHLKTIIRARTDGPAQ